MVNAGSGAVALPPLYVPWLVWDMDKQPEGESCSR